MKIWWERLIKQWVHFQYTDRAWHPLYFLYKRITVFSIIIIVSFTENFPCGNNENVRMFIHDTCWGWETTDSFRVATCTLIIMRMKILAPINRWHYNGGKHFARVMPLINKLTVHYLKPGACKFNYQWHHNLVKWTGTHHQGMHNNE